MSKPKKPTKPRKAPKPETAPSKPRRAREPLPLANTDPLAPHTTGQGPLGIW